MLDYKQMEVDMSDTTITIKQLDKEGYSVEITHKNHYWWKPVYSWEITNTIANAMFLILDCDYENIDEIMADKGFKNHHVLV